MKIGEERELEFWQEKEEEEIISAEFLSALKQILFNCATALLQCATWGMCRLIQYIFFVSDVPMITWEYVDQRYVKY